MSNTRTWQALIRDILDDGDEVNQAGRAHEPRDKKTLEFLANQTVWSMAQPLILLKERKMSYKFAFAEALWMLRGDNRLEAVAPFAPYLRNFSDDGLTLAGAYGPPFVDQAPYVVSCLVKDPCSRQAVISLWRPRPGPSKDVPCTLSLQWIIRQNQLHCVATMRSSDAWLGVPYDVSTFSILSASVLIRLRLANSELTSVSLGKLFLTAGSQHLYAIDHKPAADCVASKELIAADPLRFVADDFVSVTDLETWLQQLLIGGEVVRVTRGWLSEAVTW